MPQETPLITTIIPTFRRPQLLTRAVGSVLHQTFGRFQVCIYDNASGDETAAVAAEFARQDSRVTYHCHAKNLGAAANFNYGLACVNTPFFSFLSDDDILLPEFYETALAGFREFPDAGFFAGSVIVMTDTGQILTVPLDLWPRAGYFAPPEGLLQLIDCKLPVWTSILFRKSITDDVGPLDLEVGGSIDFDYQLRVACRHPFVISRSPCGIFVNHADSSSAAPAVSVFWPGWLKLTHNVTENPAVPEEVRNLAGLGLARYIRGILFSIGLKFILVRDVAAAQVTSDVLRSHFHDRARSSCLSAVSRIFGFGALPGRFFAASYNLARSLRNRLKPDRRRLQDKYGQYARWL